MKNILEEFVLQTIRDQTHPPTLYSGTRILYLSSIDWYMCSRYLVLTESFIADHHDYIDWYSCSRYQKLTEATMTKHMYRINWDVISCNQKLSEGFIHKYRDDVWWTKISSCQVLSEKFIEDHADMVDWSSILQYQKNLSEEFIRRIHQKNSEEFVTEHIKNH